MGRKPLIDQRKHPLYFRAPPLKQPLAEGSGGGDNPAVPGPEWFMEQVMEGLSDACMLLDGSSRLLYVNGAAKALLSPKGRILGRKLDAVLAHRQLSMLAADVYHTGKPIFTSLNMMMPAERWRTDHSFHVSLIPLWITPTRRLIRIALRDAGKEQCIQPVASRNAAGESGDEMKSPTPPQQCSEAMSRMRNPLTILQGYLENLLDGVLKDPILMRQALLTMRKHTLAIEKLMETCGK